MNGGEGSTQNYDTNLVGIVVGPGEPFWKMSPNIKKCTLLENGYVPKDPEVVIFDEPTSGLDVITAENIIHLIKDCKDQGKTVIFSSHIMSEVELLCDDLAIIHKGNLLFQGEMKTFKNQMVSDNITAEFIRIVNHSNT